MEMSTISKINSSASSAYNQAWYYSKTKTQRFFQYVKDHPTLTKMVAIPLIAYSLGQLSRFLSKMYPGNTVLELDFGNIDLMEQPLTPLAKMMNPHAVWYRDVVEALEHATNDKKIIGLVAKFGGKYSSGLKHLTFAQMNELRSAILAFSEKKLSMCYACSIGGPEQATAATREYWFATAFKEIYIVPNGFVILPGVMLLGVFFKNTLQKLEVEFQGVCREEYKTATNVFTEEKFTKYHKEQYEMLLKGLHQKMKQDIARSRNIDENIVEEWFNKAYYNAEEAKVSKLVDGILFKDELYDQFPSKFNLEPKKKPNLLFWNKYLEKKGPLYKKGNKQIALIFAEGAIVQGEKDPNPLASSDKTIYADTLSTYIRNARKDKNIKAIILRVNSPGGDAIASDVISREIELAKKDGKKVIISMAGVAASGGYWISALADHIVCNELTVTGSIGVLFGKMFTKELWSNKLGITFDDVQSNKNSNVFSSLYRFNDDQWKMSNELVDTFYESFKKHVAKGRKMDVENVAKIAKGQIYLGEEAKQKQLVDSLGGLSEAINVAKKLIDFDEKKDKLKIVRFPKQNSILQVLTSQRKKPKNSEERDKQMASISILPTLSLLSQPLVALFRYVALLRSFDGFWTLLGRVLSFYDTPVQSVTTVDTDHIVGTAHGNFKISMQDPIAGLFLNEQWFYH
jgi:protease-4